jgi:hypothetical protein
MNKNHKYIPKDKDLEIKLSQVEKSGKQTGDYADQFCNYMKSMGIKLTDFINCTFTGKNRVPCDPSRHQYRAEFINKAIEDRSNALRLNGHSAGSLESIRLNSVNEISIGQVGVLIQPFRQMYGTTAQEAMIKAWFPTVAYQNFIVNYPIYQANTGLLDERPIGTPFTALPILDVRNVAIQPAYYGNSAIWDEKFIITQRAAGSFSERGIAESIALMQINLDIKADALASQLMYKALSGGFGYQMNNKDFIYTDYKLRPELTLQPIFGYWGFIDQYEIMTLNPNARPIADLTYWFDGSYEPIRKYLPDFRKSGKLVCNPLIQKLITLNPNTNESYKTFFANDRFDKNDAEMYLRHFVPNAGNVEWMIDDLTRTDELPGNQLDSYGFPATVTNYVCPSDFIFCPFTPSAMHGTYGELATFPNVQTASSPFELGSSGKYMFMSNQVNDPRYADNPRLVVYCGYNLMPAMINTEYIFKFAPIQRVIVENGTAYVAVGGKKTNQIARGYEQSIAV